MPQILATRSKVVVIRDEAGRKGKGESFNRYRASILQDEKVLEICCLTDVNLVTVTELHLQTVEKVNFMLCFYHNKKKSAK